MKLIDVTDRMNKETFFLLAICIHIVQCKPFADECESCSPGYEPICGNIKSRSCIECNTGYYSNGHEKCEECPKCPKNEYAILNCTKKEKTRCDCKINYIRHDGSGDCLHCCDVYCEDKIETSQRTAACGNLQVLCKGKCNGGPKKKVKVNVNDTTLPVKHIVLLVVTIIIGLIILVILGIFCYRRQLLSDRHWGFMWCRNKTTTSSESAGNTNDQGVRLALISSNSSDSEKNSSSICAPLKDEAKPTTSTDNGLGSNESDGIENSEVVSEVEEETQRKVHETNSPKQINVIFHQTFNYNHSKDNPKTIQDTGISKYVNEDEGRNEEFVRKEIDNANPQRDGHYLKDEILSNPKVRHHAEGLVCGCRDPVMLDAFTLVYLGKKNGIHHSQSDYVTRWFDYLFTIKPNFSIKQFVAWMKIEGQEDIVEYMFKKFQI